MIYQDLMVAPNKGRIDFRKSFPKNSKAVNYIIEKNRSRKNIYQSVNFYDSGTDEEDIVVRIVYLDFDEDPYENCVKVANHLHEKNVEFRIAFTGRGLRIFISIKKMKFSRSLKFIIKKYSKDLLKETNALSDDAVLGDVRRIARCLNTINLKSNLYCIPLSYDQLINSSFNDIKLMAQQPSNKDDIVHKGNVVDLSDIHVDFTQKVKYYEHPTNNIDYNNVNILPLCLSQLLSKASLNFTERFYIITYLRDEGYTKLEVKKILKEYLTKGKFKHCLHEEDQLNYLFKRDELLFPNCFKLQLEGICKRCGNPDHLYF